jgi:DNA-binding XRE family transcriptional regulator
MGYRLRIPAEIGDWLAGLRESEPAAAAEVGASLAALMAAADALRPPLATPVEVDPAPGPDADLRELLDYQYQRLLEMLQRVRREVADVANQQWRLATQLEVAGLDPAMRAALERQLEAAGKLEPLLSRRARRVQSLVDAFRTEKETAKAMITAAEARVRIDEAVAELEDQTIRQVKPGDRPAMAEDLGAYAEGAASERSARLERLMAEARELESLEDPGDPDDVAPAAGRSRARVRELHADPLGSDARVFFAIEPAETIVLLSVLENAEAVARHREEAIGTAAELLADISDRGWPAGADGPGQEFGDTGEFLAQFFPQARAGILARAAGLAQRGSLASLRERAGLSAADLAQATGMSERRMEALERGDLRQATLHELTEYLRAVGATLEVGANVGGERRRLA